MHIITDSQNFEARKIALTRNVFNNKKTNIELYELSSSDRNLLNHIGQNISIKEMFPNLKNEKVRSWQEILDFTVNVAKASGVKKILALSNNKPCGLATVQIEKDSLNLIGIVSIPQDVNKKETFVANTIFCHLFKLANSLKVKNIALEAVKNSPFNLVKKYSELGFEIDKAGDRYISMVCPRRNILEQFAKLKKLIHYQEIKSHKQITII